MLERIQELSSMAAECVAKAAASKNPEVHDELLRIALHFEMLARSAEAKDTATVSRTSSARESSGS